MLGEQKQYRYDRRTSEVYMWLGAGLLCNTGATENDTLGDEVGPQPMDATTIKDPSEDLLLENY